MGTAGRYAAPDKRALWAVSKTGREPGRPFKPFQALPEQASETTVCGGVFRFTIRIQLSTVAKTQQRSRENPSAKSIPRAASAMDKRAPRSSDFVRDELGILVYTGPLPPGAERARVTTELLYGADPSELDAQV